MKKKIIVIVAVMTALVVKGQNYKINNVNADDAVVGYVEEIVAKNIQSADSSQYEFKLMQDGDAFSFEYNVSPYGINGVAKTNDVWSELEATVINALTDIKKQISKASVPEQNIVQSERKQSEAHQSQKQSAQQQQYQQPVQQPVQQQYQQQPIQQQYISNNKDYTNLMLYDYNLNDVASGNAKIGGRLKFPDGTQGVIFYLDGQGHGLAVSLDQASMKWQQVYDKRKCVDIVKVLNERSFSKDYFQIGRGMQNTNYIVNQLGGGQSPAAEWCLQHGNGWYLPSVGELWQLLGIANKVGKDNPKGLITAMLELAGGTPLNSWWYWSSSEKDKENVYKISLHGRRAETENKTEENAVRAVRSF